MGQGASSDVGETESPEDKDMIKIKVIYYAFEDKNSKDESIFEFEVELSRDEWIDKFTTNSEYLKGMLCIQEQDDLKRFIKAFAIGRVKEVRHLEITSNMYKDIQLDTPSVELGGFLHSFSKQFDNFIKKARKIFEATQMIEYDHQHVKKIPDNRIVFNGKNVSGKVPVNVMYSMDPYTYIVSLIAPSPPKQ